MSKQWMFGIMALAFCLGLNACSTAKAPAEAAIKAAEEALTGIRAEASVYVPDQLGAVEDSLAAARESFQKKEYDKALTGAKDLAAQAQDLSTAVAAKKDELARSWRDMSGILPGMVEAIQSRMNILSRSRRLPAGIDKNRFEAAKNDMANLTQTWTDASSAEARGNLMDAVAKGTAVKEKAVEIMNTLGMQTPEAAMK